MDFECLVNAPDLKQNIPILILANKCDKKYAVSELEISNALGLIEQTTDGPILKEILNDRPVKLFACSIPRKYQLVEAIDWLDNTLSTLAKM